MKKILLSFIPLVIISSCSSPKEPEFVEVKNVVITEKKHDHINFSGDVVLYNPNNIGITMTGLNLKILVNDIHITAMNQVLTSEIEPKSNFSVPVTADFDLQDLVENKDNFLSEIVKIMQSKKVDVHYLGEAKFKLKGINFTIPVDYTSEMPIK